MKKIIYCFIFLLCSCSQSELNLETSGQVVVIFQDAPDQSSTDRFLGTLHAVAGGTLIYMDSMCRRIGYVPRSIGYDTLTVPAVYGYAEVQHRNAVIDDISYLLRGGDTVLFTYGANGRPQLRSLTGEENTWLYNLPWTDPRAVQPNGYSTEAILRSHEYVHIYNMIKKKKVKLPDDLREKVMRYVVFLYLAIRDSRENWRRAVSDLQTDVLGDNYLILNPGARFLEEIQHTHIPHMLLYDRTGRLADNHAPRPSDRSIKEKIDNMLNTPPGTE